jgi:hypothetical protein
MTIAREALRQMPQYHALSMAHDSTLGEQSEFFSNARRDLVPAAWADFSSKFQSSLVIRLNP